MKQIRLCIFWTILGLLLLLSAFTQPTTHAQSAPTGETIPPMSNYLPLIIVQTPPPTVTYEAIPVMGPPTDRPAPLHADLNLALRGYTSTVGVLALIDLDGETDPQAPQLAGLFDPPRLPTFVALHQVHGWDWSCGTNGCRAGPITDPPVTLLEMATTPNEPLFIPTRNPEIYTGGYKALVLYAETNRLTLVYTREDTAAKGYTVHLEEMRVDAGLLALYQQEDAAGRSRLPALRNGQRVGFASGNTIKVVIRDTGSFMEPRSRKDWWAIYALQRQE